MFDPWVISSKNVSVTQKCTLQRSQEIILENTNLECAVEFGIAEDDQWSHADRHDRPDAGTGSPTGRFLVAPIMLLLSDMAQGMIDSLRFALLRVPSIVKIPNLDDFLALLT